tara:strand:- start:8921 stop:10663 length:1743 start_codon:yes stop_codon:yes gene_type:complete
MLMSELIELYSDLSVDQPINENSLPIASIGTCYARGICTFELTGEYQQTQGWFSIKGDNSGTGMCVVCAKADFSDLYETGQLEIRKGFFYCDHGATGGLKGRKVTRTLKKKEKKTLDSTTPNYLPIDLETYVPPKTLIEAASRGICTFAVTGKNYTLQPYFTIKGGRPGFGMCYICANADFADMIKNGQLEYQGEGKFFCDHAVEGGLEGRQVTRYPIKKAIIYDVNADSTQSQFDFIVDKNISEFTGLTRYDQMEIFATKHLLKRGDKAKIDESDIPNPDGKTTYHGSYFNLIRKCWDNHAGMVVTPDVMWFVTMNQLANFIKDHPDSFRSIFTDDPIAKKKLTFIVPYLTIDIIIDGLKKVIPGVGEFDSKRIVDLFNPSCSTSTHKSKEAIAASFCDAMEAYYSYAIAKCGVSKIRVLGMPKDWLKLVEHTQGLINLFSHLDTSNNDVKKMVNYLNSVKTHFAKIAQMNGEIWKNFYRVDQCGSGHDMIKGWFTDFYSLCYTSRGDFMIITDFKEGATVNFKDEHLSPPIKYKMCYGIFSSTLVDGFLVPNFNRVRINEGPSEPETNVEKPSQNIVF